MALVMLTYYKGSFGGLFNGDNDFPIGLASRPTFRSPNDISFPINIPQDSVEFFNGDTEAEFGLDFNISDTPRLFAPNTELDLTIRNGDAPLFVTPDSITFAAGMINDAVIYRTGTTDPDFPVGLEKGDKVVAFLPAVRELPLTIEQP